ASSRPESSSAPSAIPTARWPGAVLTSHTLRTGISALLDTGPGVDHEEPAGAELEQRRRDEQASRLVAERMHRLAGHEQQQPGVEQRVGGPPQGLAPARLRGRVAGE